MILVLAALVPCAARAKDKPPPTPADGPAAPSLVPRGTPSVSTIDADTAAASASATACEGLLASKPKLNDAKRATMLAECKTGGGDAGGVQTMAITYDPNLDHCVDSTKTLCASPDVFHFVHHYFEVSASSTLTVKTHNLVGIGGLADTVLYLVKCDDSNCSAGNVVGIDDDGNGSTDSTTPYDSLVELSSPAAGYYVAYVVAFSAGTRGITDLVISQSGGVNQTVPSQVFSLRKFGTKEIRTNDVLLVAKNPGADSMTTSGYGNYHDSKMLVVTNATNNCDGSCGRAQFQDDTSYDGGSAASTYMTRMTVGSALGSPTAAKIMIGVYDNGQVSGGEYYRMHARFAHLRRAGSAGNWPSSGGYSDSDQDGVTAEVETQLGTCDSDTASQGSDLIVTGWNCVDARDVINGLVDEFVVGTPCSSSSSQTKCWRPSDSDHDGYDDGAELFAAVVGCDNEPTGPYRVATGCARPNPINSVCDSGNWCGVEPANGNLNSPYFNQDPTVYDIFIEANHLRSTDGTVETGNPHAMSTLQQNELRELWADEPQKCWDGALTGTCPGATDLRYRVNMHAFAGQPLSLMDDRFGEEIRVRGDARFSHSHFFARANRTLRFYGPLRFGLALHHNGGGQADYSRTFSWGNASQYVDFIRRVFSHEAGHAYGLEHRVRSPNTMETTCGTPPNTTGCTWCRFDDTACTPALPNHNCSTAPTMDTAAPENPAPTLMSEQYAVRGGMLPMQKEPPSGSTDYSNCSFYDVRFSKGLLGRSLDETGLDNSWQPGAGWEEWKLRHLTQVMFCYDSQNQCRGRGTFGLFNSSGVQIGPYCDVNGSGAATQCYFNWNGQTATPTNTSSALGNTDISSGRWNNTPNVLSNAEVLEDQNEWGRMIAVGRDALDPWKGMCLYATAFNGPTTSEDYCGWGEQITASGATAGVVNYPVGGCTTAATCAGASATCTLDPATCTQGSDCFSSTCSGGVCTCIEDADCRSGQCIAGRCLVLWGSCSCLNSNDCPGQGPGACVAGRCMTFRSAAAVYPAGADATYQPWAVGASAGFDGTDDRIRLHGGASSRLEALGANYENRLSLQFDFRFDGFQGTETQHVLLKSGSFQLSVVTGGQVQATVGGREALVWSGLQTGVWYRAIWSASKNDQGHYLWMRRMDEDSGWYAPADNGSGGACVWQSWPNDLSSPGDVWIGHDGSSDSSRYFHGRVDTLALVNFVSSDRPVGCTQQQ